MKARPYILTISGFDPSNGAGLTADVKTIESLKAYAISVCTANTVQNDKEFAACYWTPIEVIKEQLEVLSNSFDFEFVKIGIIERWEVLNEVIDFVLAKNPNAKIVLDPVLKSSSEFDFHTAHNWILFESILKKVYLLTPNYNEIKALFPEKTIEETIEKIIQHSNLYLKGGHRLDKLGTDQLFTQDGKQFTLNPKAKRASEKHGSGCILSTAITSYLAHGFPILKACFRGKRYTERVLESNSGLLGYHR